MEFYSHCAQNPVKNVKCLKRKTGILMVCKEKAKANGNVDCLLLVT